MREIILENLITITSISEFTLKSLKCLNRIYHCNEQ